MKNASAEKKTSGGARRAGVACTVCTRGEVGEGRVARVGSGRYEERVVAVRGGTGVGVG